MKRGALGALLAIVACGGCRMCSDCCDYLPPVANGQYAVWGQRAGSAFGPDGVSTILSNEIPDPNDPAMIQPLPPVEPETPPPADSDG